MDKTIKNIDLLIIGAGPAGLTASIYAARAKLDAVTLEEALIGGQIRDSYLVENYPGFISITGPELTEKFFEHAIAAKANIDEFDRINSVNLSDTEKIIETDNAIYKPIAVIIASGLQRRRLPVPEEGKFYGNGVHYCELCDGALYEGKELVVVGGGNSAVEAALYLTKYAKSITMIHQLDHFQAEKANQEKIFNHEKINIIWNSEIRNILGDKNVEGVKLQNLKTQEYSELKIDGIFVYIGSKPTAELFKGFVELDDYGYIKTDENMQTNIDGVFAAGDIRSKAIRQLTTAVGDATTAALMAEKYINKNR